MHRVATMTSPSKQRARYKDLANRLRECLTVNRSLSVWFIFGALGLAGCSNGGSSPIFDNTVVSTPSTQSVSAVVGGAAQTVAIAFAATEAAPASQLSMRTDLLPTGWQASSAMFSCSEVSTGNGCTLNLTFKPTTDVHGTLSLSYTYDDGDGVAKSGSVNVPYSSTQHDNVVANISPAGQISAVAGAGSQTVTVTFTTDDGNVASAFELSTSLSALPAGWSSVGSSLTCASVSTGNGCRVALNYAPTTQGGGTLTLNYGYRDNAGSAKTGSVSIPYTATVHDNVVATANPSGTVTVNTGSSQPVTVTFTTDDGNVASDLAVTSGLPSLPAGWSAADNFTCAKVSTGISCQLPLTYAPTAGASGTLVLGYAYNDNSGASKTGSVSIAYVGQSIHVYVIDASAGSILECSIGTSGALMSCPTAASGLSYPYGLSFYGSTDAYLSQGAEVDLCSVNIDGTLANCASVQGGYNGVAGFVTVNDSFVYVANVNSFGGPQYCAIQSNGTLASCSSSNGAASNNQATGVAFYGQYAYVSTVGDQNQPGVRVCAVGNDGSLSNCADSGSGLQAANNVVADAAGNVYAIGNAITHCTVGPGGALTSCQSLQAMTAPQGDYLYYGGGFALYGAYAYVAYDIYDVNTSTDTPGIAVCSVANDGTFSSCADSGQTFTSTAGIAIH